MNIFAFVYSVLAIELTLYWNSISGVYDINSTGQLIPFVIGLLGLLKMTYAIFPEVRQLETCLQESLI